jgi:hypothetical protein
MVPDMNIQEYFMLTQETAAYLETNFPSIEVASTEEFGVNEVKAFATTLIPITIFTTEVLS